MANRATEESKAKSEKMRAISKGKGSKAAQMKAIEKAALIKLVSFIYGYHGNCQCMFYTASHLITESDIHVKENIIHHMCLCLVTYMLHRTFQKTV